MPALSITIALQLDDTAMDKQSYVYILASRRYGTFYIGVTSDLIGRVWQHKEGFIDGFTKTHQINQLVWYEVHTDIIAAITREKQIKKWRRDCKINLIQSINPTWHDLYPTLAWLPSPARRRPPLTAVKQQANAQISEPFHAILIKFPHVTFMRTST